MKCPTVYSVSVITIGFLGWINCAMARPIDFSEVSLLVRAHEPESSIINDVSQRKLVHSLTSQQENTLKSEGASNSLLQSLRNSNYVMSKEDAAAFDMQRDQQAKAAKISKDSSNDCASCPNIQVVDVALGHPINLSQWGGYDYELAFYAYRFAGEDIVEPVNIDPIRTYSDVTRYAYGSEDEVFANNAFRRQRFMSYDNDAHRFTPYNGRRDLKDDRINGDKFSDTVAVTSRSVSRPLAIDWSSPVAIKGVPYALYPVYAEGGVSLYYISSSSTSVRLAVSTTRM
jgi:hypothetical protein